MAAPKRKRSHMQKRIRYVSKSKRNIISRSLPFSSFRIYHEMNNIYRTLFQFLIRRKNKILN